MAKAEKTCAGNRWTYARKESFIRSALRRAFTRWPVAYDVRKALRREYKGSNPRQQWEYQCSMCQAWFSQKETQLDHYPPCGSLRPLDKFVDTLFCEAEGLRIVCKKCHKQITHKSK